MTWGNKKRIWSALVAEIQSEIDANRHIIPEDRITDIEHYLDHGEYSIAFEYLYLEIMERQDALFVLGVDKAREIALFFELNDESECMVDGKFWPKFEAFLDIRTKLA
jgi:hypothetical protein